MPAKNWLNSSPPRPATRGPAWNRTATDHSSGAAEGTWVHKPQKHRARLASAREAIRISIKPTLKTAALSRRGRWQAGPRS